MTPQRALLLLGSPRPASKSNSESLGTYLMEQLAGRGIACETLSVHEALSPRDEQQGQTGLARLLDATEHADLIVLATPLYVDSLPAPVIRAMELVRDRLDTSDRAVASHFFAIVSCGFPETIHTETAVAICRRFAKEVGYLWMGGVGLGGGEAIAGRPLPEAGGLVRNVRKALGVAADALAEGGAVPATALKLMHKPLMPASIYARFGNAGWKKRARRKGLLGKLRSRPYAADDQSSG